MKKGTLLIAVIIVGAGILLIPFICDNGDNGHIDPLENKHYSEVKDSIKSIADSEWSVQKFKDVQSLINAKSSAGLIKSKMKDDLTHSLNLNYLPILVDETYDFYKYACDDRDKLSVLNKELKRYIGDEQYDEAVRELRLAASDVYAVAGWNHGNYSQYSTSYFRDQGNLHGLIYKYVQRNNRDKDYEKSIVEQIREKSDNDLVDDCSIVNKGMKENYKRLDDFVYSIVKDSIEKYIKADSSFNTARHENMLNRVKNYRDLNYTYNQDRQDSLVEELVLQLDEFYARNIN